MQRATCTTTCSVGDEQTIDLAMLGTRATHSALLHSRSSHTFEPLFASPTLIQPDKQPSLMREGCIGNAPDLTDCLSRMANHGLTV